MGEAEAINALRTAKAGLDRSEAYAENQWRFSEALRAARDAGLTDEVIAGELGLSADELEQYADE